MFLIVLDLNDILCDTLLKEKRSKLVPIPARSVDRQHSQVAILKPVANSDSSVPPVAEKNIVSLLPGEV